MESENTKEKGLKLLRTILKEDAEKRIESWKKIHPSWEDFVLNFVFGTVWSRPGLDLRTRSLITVAALTVLGREQELRLHIGMAIKNGATPQEVREAILQMTVYGGFPAAREALLIANEILG